MRAGIVRNVYCSIQQYHCEKESKEEGEPGGKTLKNCKT